MKTFDTVPIRKPSCNVFNLSHDVKASYNFDKLYPFLCHPVYPGDTFNCRAEVFLRTMPLKAPVLHNVDMFLYFFFVPFRLEWNEKRKDDWRTFITGGEDGYYGAFGHKKDERNDYVLPHFNYQQLRSLSAEYVQHGSLLDHMGFPSIDASDFANLKSNRLDPICSLPFRAYQTIYNEYFRNQNLQNEVEFSYGSGIESATDLGELLKFRKKCWEKDYFTSALPFQQRGEAMNLPIKVNADGESSATGIDIETVVTDMRGLVTETTSGLAITDRYDSGNTGYAAAVGADPGLTSQAFEQGEPVELYGSAHISTEDLTIAGLQIGTITDLRYCLRLQQFLENNARCGSRYIEQILAHFGVRSSDARLQRPELLGGGKVPLIFTDVPQTSETTEESVQGNLSGKGELYGKTGGFKKYFEEHGVLMGILCIIPRTSYSQGIPRYWTAMDKTDWYFPEFAHLSEQAILNKEVYYNPTEFMPVDEDLQPDGVWGYQGRYTELRYIPSSVHGEMKSDLQYWHFGRLFSQLPPLNASFVEAGTRANVFAMEDIANGEYDPFVAQIHLDVKAVRPMPKFAVPTL